MPNVNPEVLSWARETAGLSLAEAGHALGFDGKRRSGDEKLAAIEAGKEPVSRPQLLKMAKVYRRPLLVFYMEKPPAAAARGQDFRTLPPELAKESAGEVEMLVRDVHVRQQLVRSALEDADEADPLPFVGSVGLDASVDNFTGRIRDAIKFDLKAFRAHRKVDDAFTYARDAVERSGVFVLLIGNLGSHHSNISPEVFRGFALADQVAPFVVINDQDAKAAWAFTLFHELAHIWLGQSGISGAFAAGRLEKLCNSVASELLLPASELAGWSPEFDDVDGYVRALSDFAAPRNISRALVSYRLLLSGVISADLWRSGQTVLRELWLRERQEGKQPGSKPSYYVVRRHRVGGALLQVVRRGLQEGILTPTKAGRVLGVKPTNVEPLVAAV